MSDDDDDQAHIWKFVATMARLHVLPQEIPLRYFDRSDLDLPLVESGYSILGWQVWNPMGDDPPRQQPRIDTNTGLVVDLGGKIYDFSASAREGAPAGEPEPLALPYEPEIFGGESPLFEQLAAAMKAVEKAAKEATAKKEWAARQRR
jgi:hypothetical protein